MSKYPIYDSFGMVLPPNAESHLNVGTVLEDMVIVYAKTYPTQLGIDNSVYVDLRLMELSHYNTLIENMGGDVDYVYVNRKGTSIHVHISFHGTEKEREEKVQHIMDNEDRVKSITRERN